MCGGVWRGASIVRGQRSPTSFHAGVISLAPAIEDRRTSLRLWRPNELFALDAQGLEFSAGIEPQQSLLSHHDHNLAGLELLRPTHAARRQLICGCWAIAQLGMGHGANQMAHRPDIVPADVAFSSPILAQDTVLGQSLARNRSWRRKKCKKLRNVLPLCPAVPAFDSDGGSGMAKARRPRVSWKR